MITYLTVMAHFFTADWELHSELLSFRELEGQHTGKNISEELYEVIQKFSIQGKVQFEYQQINSSSRPYDSYRTSQPIIFQPTIRHVGS